MNGSSKEPAQSGSFDSFHDQALAALSEGRLAHAESQCLRAKQIEPNHAGIHNLLGQVYLGQKRYVEATNAFSRAIKIGPPRPNLFYNLALAQQGLGSLPEAAEYIKSAIRLDPSAAVLHAKLGQLLSALGASPEAIPALRQALTLDPKAVPVRLNLAQALTDVGQLTEAEALTRETLFLNPKEATAHRLLGRIHQLGGRFKEAVACFETSIELQPIQGSAYFALAYSKQSTEEDRSFLARMDSLLNVPTLPENDRSLLQYALGKGFDDLGEYAVATKHFKTANKICLSAAVAAGREFDADLESKKIDRIIDLFPADVFSRWSGRGSDSNRPVFVVGMIRSGTTLVEQILSRHPDVFPAGELRFWTENEPRMLYEMVASETPEISSWISAYEAELDQASFSTSRIVDKMPLNFWALGLIHLAYPKAKIIHCRRNPLDTCLSIYVTPYRTAPDFAHNLQNIATAYRDYLKLMDHWRRVIPSANFLELDYETLVADPEDDIRKMVDFLDLKWNDSCLSPAAASRSVNTPSQWQVRQPIYRKSVERWRNYSELLNPILDL